MTRPIHSLEIRFNRNIQPVTESGCWIWMGKLNSYGYGRMVKAGGRGKETGAHRVAYEMFIGPIDNGLVVCHRCDMPCCVNPNHLFLGTQSDNIKDRTNKKREPRGENTSWAKLNDDIVRKIRNDVGTCNYLAEKYNISRSMISKIKLRKSWVHVDD